jgi:hypothetical protein
MPVTLSDEQAKNWAATHRTMANVLDPPATPTPTPPSGGGSTPDPSGFTGRTLGNPAVWKQQASFEENFPTLAPRGQFLSIYKMWGAYPVQYQTTDKQGFYDPKNIAVVDVDGTRCMELRVVSGKTNGTGKPSGATPEARLLGPKQDGYTTGERIQSRMKLFKPGPGGHFVPLGWPRLNSNWPANGEPDYVEVDTGGSPNVGGWFHVQNGGSSGQGQVRLQSDVSMLDWFTVTAERIPGQSYRWYVNGKLYKQVLAPGGIPKPEEKAVTTVLNQPYNIPLYELRWPIQFESKGTAQTNDVIVLVDHWSLWERI